MNKNKKHNVLHIGLSAFLFYALGINPCYADNPAEIVSISYDASSGDQAIGIGPDVFPKGYGVKLLTVKNNYPQEITIVDITSKHEQSYAVLSKPSEPIKIPVDETHTFELQPGNCPYITTKEEQINFDFSYSTIVDGNTVNKVFSIVVGVSCHGEFDRTIEAKDAALRERDTALKATEQEKTAKENALKTIEQERTAKEDALKAIEQERTAKEEALKAIEQERIAKEEALKTAKTECETSCKEDKIQLRNETREEDRKNCNAKIKKMQEQEEL